MTEEFDCDICGSPDAEEIAVARRYMDSQPLHVCKNCGFVYVRKRRSPEEIGAAWSDEIYNSGNGEAQVAYTARIPAIKARQTFAAEFIDGSIGLRGKRVLDIGAGEGQFLEIIGGADYGANPFAVEPSQRNCELIKVAGIESFAGTIEEFRASPEFNKHPADIVTVVWTLENCQSCRFMFDAAYDALVDGGHLAVATGSRVLVPFKKPLHYYLGTNAADTHAFRFSANSLANLLAVSGFRVSHTNRYIDSDWLVMIGEKAVRGQKFEWRKDDCREVVDFFERWDRETRAFYEEA